MRMAVRAAAILLCVLGLVHLGVGYNAFVNPTEPRVWFAAAGFLLIVTGIACLAAEEAPTRLNALSALAGTISVLILGLLFGAVAPNIIREPQSLLLIAVAAFLTVRLAGSLRRSRRRLA